MKRFLITAILFLLARVSNAQNDLQKCMKMSFGEMDTVISRGKNPWIEWGNCVKGKHIPDFLANTITGQAINTKDLRNKVLFINFWFIDCPPCIAELPALNKLAAEYFNRDVVFIAVTHESLKRLTTSFFPKHEFDFAQVANGKDIIETFGGVGYPNSFIIDKKGTIKEAWIGGSTDEKAETEVYLKAKPIIDELLKAE